MIFASLCSGKILVPINKNMPKEEIQIIINRAKIDTIFVSDKFKEKIENLGIRIYNFDDKNLFQDIEVSKDFEDYIVNPDETSLIYFTYGTTGKSKVVELSQKNIISNMIDSSKVLLLESEVTCLSVLPQNHVLEGLFSFLQSFYKGCKRVLYIDLDDIINYIKKNEITFMGAVPAIYEYLYNRKDELKECSSIRALFNGGAKLNEALIQNYKEFGMD